VRSEAMTIEPMHGSPVGGRHSLRNEG
jgi:hypothetical protein